MEEASTITKAIENAWNRAGQPQEFTVKILELPKTSFFGLKTSKSAKIALVFNEMTVKAKEQPQKQVRPLAPRQPHDRREQKEPFERQQLQRRPLQPREQQRDQQRPERSHESRQARPDQRRPQGPRQPYRSEGRSSDEQRNHEPRNHERENWTPEMVQTAQEWVKETLVLMGKPDIKVIPQVSHNYLKLYLDQPC